MEVGFHGFSDVSIDSCSGYDVWWLLNRIKIGAEIKLGAVANCKIESSACLLWIAPAVNSVLKCHSSERIIEAFRRCKEILIIHRTTWSLQGTTRASRARNTHTSDM